MFAGGDILLPIGHVPVPVFQAVDLVVGAEQPIKRRWGQRRFPRVAQGPGEQRHAATGAGQRHVGQPDVFPETLGRIGAVFRAIVPLCAVGQHPAVVAADEQTVGDTGIRPH